MRRTPCFMACVPQLYDPQTTLIFVAEFNFLFRARVARAMGNNHRHHPIVYCFIICKHLKFF